MRWKSSVAIRTKDTEIVYPVIVMHSIYVIQNKRHFLSVPVFTLSAKLAFFLFESFVKQTPLQMCTAIS